MAIALKDKPIHPATIPENIIVARINRHSGQVTDQTDPDGIDEYFVMGTEPHALVRGGAPAVQTNIIEPSSTLDELF